MAQFHPCPDLPTVRRVVTGHTTDGKAVFDHDDEVTPVTPAKSTFTTKGLAAGFTLIHRTTGFPVQVQGGDEELRTENLRRSVGGGIVCEIVDFPPSSEDAKVYLHRNSSLDYMVILKGSLVAVLEDDVEKTLHEGDVMVQKGTLHGWKNTTNEYCRYMVVIIPAEPARLGSTGEPLEISKIPGLTD